MPIIERTALVARPASMLYAIVDDVNAYPDFLPWCSGAQVLEQDEHVMVARLDVLASGIRERFTTRNRRFPVERIELSLVDGPFRRFSGVWTFTRLGADEGCKVSLQLDFELSGARALLGSAFGGFFVKAADRMVDAFCARAQSLPWP